MEAIDLIIGDRTVFLANVLLGIFGLLLSWMLEAYRYWRPIRDNGGLSHYFCNQKQVLRLVLSLMAIVAGVLFSEDLVGVPLTNFTAFLAGFSADKIINSLMNRK